MVKGREAYVAMVLCQETEYVLLDEPLNNLDVALCSNDGALKVCCGSFWKDNFDCYA